MRNRLVVDTDAPLATSRSGTHSLDGYRRDEYVFQNLHWGLNLLLKAFLHAHSWTDARCIAEIGHDLERALAACEVAGLDVDHEARSFIADLSRYSHKHRVAEFVNTGADGWTVVTAAEIGRRLRTSIGGVLHDQSHDHRK